MSTGLMHKLRNWVTGDPYDDTLMDYMDEYDMNQYSQPAASEYELEATKKTRKHLKVVDHPATAGGMQQVVVIEPRAFEEALDLIEHLRNRRSVLINLHMLDTDQSQRVVDFLSGATHAIEGHQQRIGDGVFMFTPSNVMIEHQKPYTAMTPAGGETYWH